MNIRETRAVRNKFITGGYPPRANVKNKEEDRVLVMLKLVSLEEIIRPSNMIAFQLKQGITKKVKYMKESMKGVRVVNKEKSIYALLVVGSFRYLANSDTPRLKPRKPNRLFMIGNILP